MLDSWQEIFHTMRQNTLRTFLTGLAVSWGIFILVLLLGVGNGLENGVKAEFADDAMSGIWVRSGQTTMAHDGMQPGRNIEFTNDDYEDLKRTVHEMEHISAEFWIWRGNKVSYKQENGSFTIRAVHPDYKYIEFREMISGRFLNEIDVEEARKVCVIGSKVVEALFKDQNPVGEMIRINDASFKVVGTFKDNLSGMDAGRIYLPIYTAQKLISGSNVINEVMLTTNHTTAAANEEVADFIRKKMADKHNFDPKDIRAVHITNQLEQYERFNQLFNGMSKFVWVIGIGTLIAGIIGVGNIMLIVVKERTREIGIRKAIGARPRGITLMIVIEAIVITSISGYVGMLCGIGLLELAAAVMPPEMKLFANPTVDIRAVLLATGMLVFFGTLAGLFPALRAANIKPIEALREE